MKYHFLLLLLLSCIGGQLLAQGSKATPKVNYDSSYDVTNLPCNLNPKSLIGQQIYFFKRNAMFSGGEMEKDTIYRGLIARKKTPIDPLIPAGFLNKLHEPGWNIFDYNTGRIIPFIEGTGIETEVYKPVLAISNMKQLLIFTPYSALENKLFTIVACTNTILTNSRSCNFNLTLTDNNNDTLSWTIGSISTSFTICFKGFIDYLRAHYPNKKLYVKADSWVQPFYSNPMDKTTGETIPGKEYLCTDMTLVNEPQLLFPQIGLLLTGSDGKLLAVEPDIKGETGTALPLAAFWTEAEYKVYAKQEKKRQDSLIVLRNGRETRIPKLQPDYVKAIEAKYGKDTARYIIRKEVVAGMNKEMCLEAWGNPGQKNMSRSLFNNEEIEVWAYSQYKWLRFKSGRLIYFNE